jgi:hypothetical protein
VVEIKLANKMVWEEKIDRLKSENDPKDFRVPFTGASTILNNVEAKFVIKDNSNYRFSNWADRIKDKQKIRNVRKADLDTELIKLNPDNNYWVVLSGRNPSTKNLIYDSKPSVISKLVRLRDDDFYIVDKKYHWLAYFKFNQTDIDVFKSGDKQTPWD